MLGLHVWQGVDRSDELTLRHLVGQTSGLADYREDRPKGGRSMIDEALERDDGWTAEEALERVHMRLRPHFQPHDPRDPRARSQYSDTNYLLLKAVLEVGRPPALVGHTGSTGTWAFHCPALDLDLVGTVDQVTAGPVPFRAVGGWLRAARQGLTA